MINKEKIVAGVEEQMVWWIEQRKSKLRDELSDSMSLNPFLAPFLYDFHDVRDLSGLISLLLAGHLLVGHNTGFGKLVDEKILPNVFDTTKLDRAFRRSTAPFEKSCFDDIDHLVPREGSKPALLSLKAGRWTIQLSQAVGLNRSFETIAKEHPGQFDNIVVGVFYGSQETLTDKYRLLRGISDGAEHNVVDLRQNVHVYAGKEFWAWLNNGETDTQQWILEGILKGMNDTRLRQECAQLVEQYTTNLTGKYGKYVGENGKLDWHRLLADINE